MAIPTFLAFQTASRALSASQSLLNITGNNIANVNTEGYTRQRVDLSSISSSGYTQKLAVKNTSTSLGVEATGVSQIRDTFLDARYRTENSDNGMYSNIVDQLNQLESIFDEVDTEGLQAQLSNFINQMETFSQSPTSQDVALVVKTSAQSLTAVINSYAQQVKEVREQAVYDLENVAIADFNTIVKNIANLNRQIKEEQTFGNNPNELLDKRNTLIDRLSNIANIKVAISMEQISDSHSVENLTISLYDESTGTSIGLVNNGMYNTLALNTKGETAGIELYTTFGAHDTLDITDHFKSGAITGYLNIINGQGSYGDSFAGENEFRGTMYYTKALDTFAATFAKTLNDLNDDPATAEVEALFSTSDASAHITAENITISKEWSDDSLFITTTKPATASSSTNEDGNDNILLMIKALGSDIDFYENADTTASLKFSGTFSEYMTGVVAELALDITLNKDYLDTSDNVLASLGDSRDSVSGVSLDEEGVNLLAYQKSYSAAARYMTVLDEAMDRLINYTGVVGR